MGEGVAWCLPAAVAAPELSVCPPNPGARACAWHQPRAVHGHPPCTRHQWTHTLPGPEGAFSGGLFSGETCAASGVATLHFLCSFIHPRNRYRDLPLPGPRLSIGEQMTRVKPCGPAPGPPGCTEPDSS